MITPIGRLQRLGIIHKSLLDKIKSKGESLALMEFAEERLLLEEKLEVCESMNFDLRHEVKVLGNG